MISILCSSVTRMRYLLLAFLVAFALPAMAQQRTMVIGTYGGQIRDVIRDIARGFEKKHNVKIVWVSGTSNQLLARVQATAANPEFDVVFGGVASHPVGSKNGLFAPLDEAIVTNLKDVVPMAVMPQKDGVGFGLLSVGLFYNTNEFTKMGRNPPTKWADLFDPAYCGRVTLNHLSANTGLLSMGMVAGGTFDNMDAAIASVIKDKKCLLPLETEGGVIEQKIQTGEYILGAFNSVRVISLMQKGVPIRYVVPSDKAAMNMSTVAVVKGAKNPELAQQFVDWMLAPEAQQTILSDLAYGPVNTKVNVPAELVKMGVVTASDADKYVLLDFVKGDANQQKWVESLNRGLAQ